LETTLVIKNNINPAPVVNIGCATIDYLNRMTSIASSHNLRSLQEDWVAGKNARNDLSAELFVAGLSPNLGFFTHLRYPTTINRHINGGKII